MRHIEAFLMLLSIFTTFFTIPSILYVSANPELPVVSITAPETVYASEKKFNITVGLSGSIPSVFLYQVYMTVDDSIVSIKRAWIPTWNDSWIFYGKMVIQTEPAIYDRDGDNANEAVQIGSSLVGEEDISVSGTNLLAIIELEIKSSPATAHLSIDNEDTFIWDYDLEDVSIEKQNGQVNIVGDMPTQPSQITIDVNPTTAFTGQNVTITGQITPDKPNVDVTIEQKQGKLQWRTLAEVKTNQTSQYKHVCSFSENDTYLFRASWLGDETHLGNVSEKVEITVEPLYTRLEIRFADEDLYRMRTMGNQSLPLPTPPATMNVTVKNATDLRGWKIKIYYDPDIVRIDDIRLPTDNVLNLTGLTYTTSVDTGTDYAYCEAAIINQTEKGYNGNGTLFQFDLTGLSAIPEPPEPGTTLSISTESILNLGGNQTSCGYEELVLWVIGLTSTIIEVINPKTGKNNFTFYSEETSVGDVFNATIRVENATNLYGWLLKLTYNATLLNATRVIKPSGNTTYVFHNKVSEMNYTLENGAVTINNTLTEGEEPFEESGLLVVIEFEILLAPTNETAELRSSLTVEEQEIFNGLIWQTPAKEDGEYVFKYGARPSEDEEEPTWLEDYWPYIVGLIVVVIVVYLAFRRLRKGREISPEEKEI